MKKLMIALLAVFALTACNNTAKAQITLYRSGATIATITALTTDTLDNSETTYFSTRTGDLNKYTTANYTAYFMMDTISGTTTPGNVVQQGSYDGTTWFNLSGNVYGGITGTNCDTLTWSISNVANLQNTVWTTSGSTKYSYGVTSGNFAPRVLYYRLKFVSSGTQSTRVYNVKLLPFTK